MGRGKCFLQCVPSPGQPPPVPLSQSLAVNVASCPSLLPPLTHKQGSEQGQWHSRRWQDNAHNNSSALINLSSGSQAKGAMADCCVSQSDTLAQVNPEVLLFLSLSYIHKYECVKLAE